VGDNITVLQGLLLIPLRNAIFGLMATVLGMIIGSITLAVKRKPPQGHAESSLNHRPGIM
jgi:hypothetical protein